jgi:DNA-binding response OmpR family regulator
MVVMDVGLEGAHTFDLARELRRKGIPFVFYTAWENESSVKIADQAG